MEHRGSIDDGVSDRVARESLRLAASKLPIRTRFVSRNITI